MDLITNKKYAIKYAISEKFKILYKHIKNIVKIQKGVKPNNGNNRRTST